MSSRLWGFVTGVTLVTVGVLLHVPDVATMVRHAKARPMPGMEPVPGMPQMAMWTPTTIVGMLLLVTGVMVTAAVLFRGANPPVGSGVSLDAIEHGRLQPIYCATCMGLTLALVIDIMKPLTIGFVMPGMREEYGMSLAAVSVLPVVALTGTVVGSVAWGLLGDRYGRRPPFLLATVLFIATSTCGAMPSFTWNLVMCFVMGSSAGGLLPLAFSLVAELAPRRHRAWMAVTIGGVGGLGGYLAASTAAYYLEPLFTWRALWLIGLPTGLLLLGLMPLIPESPLFLLHSGEREEAEKVLQRYGSHLGSPISQRNNPDGPAHPPGLRTLLQRYPGLTTVIGIVGVVWGLVNFGFLVMLPAQLRETGISTGAASGLLAKSALYSAPALVLVVLLYAGWSGRRSLALFIGVTGVALGGVAVWSVGRMGPVVLLTSIGTLVLGLSAVNAMLLPYCAEIYPTALRATGSGVAAATTKFGGILGPFAMLLSLKFSEGLRTPALVLSALSFAAAILMLRYGREVRRTSPFQRQKFAELSERVTTPPADHL